MRLTYAIKYVDDMDRAVAFYRDKLGLEPAFQSPFWSEFATGDTKLALHPASGDNKAGHVELGFEVDDVLASASRRRLHRVDFGEDVGRQALDSVEFVVHRRQHAADAAAQQATPTADCSPRSGHLRCRGSSRDALHAPPAAPR